MKLSKTERVQAVWNHEYSPLWWVAGDPPPKVQVGEVGRIERGGRWVRAKNQPRLRDPFTATTMAGPMMRATESTVQRSKVWFPPNRGVLPYAASRSGAAVFS